MIIQKSGGRELSVEPPNQALVTKGGTADVLLQAEPRPPRLDWLDSVLRVGAGNG